jgi:hypothetical protein
MKVLNIFHNDIEIGPYNFPSFQEVSINVNISDPIFRDIRCNKMLRVDKYNNDEYIKKHKLDTSKKYNMCYDSNESYIHAIEALADPIMKHLEPSECGYCDRPMKGVNIRFFNSRRLREGNKIDIGKNDIFMSHGIGDKNYWIGKFIDGFNYAFSPGPLWTERMRNTGFKGEIFEVGYTKLDPLFPIYYEGKKDKPIVSWLPTHGYHSKDKGRSSYPFFEDYIKDISNDYYVNTGNHPTTKLHMRQKQNPTLELYRQSDVIIADAGSTLYEAWALGIPVIFPDWICKDDVLRHFKDDPNNLEYRIYNEGIGYHAKDMKELNKMLDLAMVNGFCNQEEEFIDGVFPEKYRGRSGENVANVLKGFCI